MAHMTVTCEFSAVSYGPKSAKLQLLIVLLILIIVAEDSFRSLKVNRCRYLGLFGVYSYILSA